VADGSIKIISGMLDVDTDEAEEEYIILRGVVDPSSLERLRIDDYQREQLGPTKIATIIKGIKSRGVPDINLGMRGERYIERESGIFLQDSVYIIDGLQRVTAGLQMLATPGSPLPRLGMKLHFNTTYEFEKDLFDKLNVEQTKLNSNVLLRNRHTDIPVMGALYKLTSDRAFVMKGQICWGQNMRRGDLISAVTYVKIAAMLHSHAGPGRSNSALDLANGLQKILENVGRQKLVENVRVFFEVVDSVWGIRRVYYRGGATFLKSGFLIQLARVFSDHAIFWKDDLLVVDQQTRKKLQQFRIDDPEVVRLASASGMAGEILYALLVDHINSGRRSNRLVPRRSSRDRPLVEGNGANGTADEEEVSAE